MNFVAPSSLGSLCRKSTCNSNVPTHDWFT
jgi:hypothetical protein